MYNLLSVLGHKNSNKDLKDLLKMEDIELFELTVMSIEALYQEMTNNHYDYLVFRDSVIENSLNIASIVQRIFRINENIKVILVLDKEYDDFIYQKLKMFDVSIMYETNISKIRDAVIQHHENHFAKENIEDYEVEDDFIFNLASDKEVEAEKPILDTEENETEANTNKRVIFPIQHINRNKEVYLFLNMHEQETQLAMQFAKTLGRNKSIVYLEFDKRNEVLFRDLHSMNLTTIALDKKNTLENVLKIINEFKQDGNVLVINTFYMEELLLLYPIVETFIETMQSKYHIENLVKDASLNNYKKKHNVFLAYYTKGLPNIEYLSKIYTGDYHPIFNSRLAEYVARKNNKLTEEGDE